MLGFATIIALIILVLAAIIAALIGAWLKHRAGRGPFKPYRRVDALLTPSEKALYTAATRAVGEWGVVMVKVRLWDLLWVPKETKYPELWRNRVWHKHADVVVCDAATLRPLVVLVAADDQNAARIVDLREPLKAAGIPMIVVEQSQLDEQAPEQRSMLIATLTTKLAALHTSPPGAPAADVARAELD